MWPFTRRNKAVPVHRRVEPQVISVRSFKAAQTDRLKASWGTVPMTINEIIRRDLRPLRARSRAQGQNDPYARRFLQMCRSHVVGPDGMHYQSRVYLPDGTLDRPVNQALEQAWKRWGRAEFCHVEGKCGWPELLRQIVATVAEDGECLIRMMEGGPFGLQLQIIDAERLEILFDREATATQNAIRMGVELDSYQRPVAYWFSSGQGDYYYAGNRYVRVPAEQIIHAFLPFRAGAWRGIPWTATSLTRLNMLDGYEDAALVNARVGASKMGFFLTEDGTAPMGEAGADGDLVVSAEPGEFEALPATVKDFRTFDPLYPNGEFPVFVKQILRGVAAGLGVSYHTLSGDLEAVNFSSARIGTQEDREIWKQIQNWLIDTVCSRVHGRWLDSAVLYRQVPGADLKKMELYKQAASWQPRRWAYIQPQQEMEANKIALLLRLRSRSEIIREDGRDPDEVWAEIQNEEQHLRDRGIDPALPDQPYTGKSNDPTEQNPSADPDRAAA